VSVTASDDVEINSTSTTTDPSVTEQDLNNVDDKQMTMSPRSTASRPPVQLLRRQLNHPSSATSSTPPPPSQSVRQTSTSMTTSDTLQPSSARVDSTTHTSVKETVDPSLLEAFANPMNRQYLLQLEGSLNNFITQTRFGITLLYFSGSQD
jgi:hypothetical protein